MLDFKRIRLIARREWLTRLRQRTFQITTIIQVIFILLGASVPTAVAVLSEGDSSGSSTILVLDGANASIVDRLAPYVAGGGSPDAMAGVSTIELQPSGIGADEAKQRVDDGDVDAALIVTRNGTQDLNFVYFNTSGDNDADAQRIYAGANAISVEDRLERSGVDQRAYQAAIAPPAFQLQGMQPGDGSDESDFDGARYGISLAFTVLMFMSIMLYGTWVAQGVVEEKSSRIMEIMVNAATPRDLLAGKVLGIGLAALTQLIPILLVGGLVFAFQRRIVEAIDADTDAIADIAFGSLSATAVGWFLVYFLLGFVLYAAMYAALGSLVSRQEEVNQAISPMMTIMFVGYFAALFSINASDNVFSRFCAIFPLTSPFVMISRTVMGRAESWEIALSLALLIASLILVLLFAARVYRVGVLMYGQKPSWKAVFNAGTAQAVR